MKRPRGRRAGGALALAAVAALSALVTACGSPRTPPAPSQPAGSATVAMTAVPPNAVSPGPPGSPVAGPSTPSGAAGGSAAPPSAGAAAWREGTVEQPVDVGSAAGSSGVFCSPCHVAQETSLTAVAARRQTLVAVGMQFPPAHAAAWVSTDGLRWQRAAGLAASAGSVMSAVTATGAGFVAVGNAGAAAAAWTSPDGRTWSAATVAGGAAGAQGMVARMHAVAAGADGLVAAGEVSGPAGGRAAFWTSADGRAWTPVRDQPSFAGGSVSGVVVAGAGLVAVGTVNVAGSTWAATWFSTDGRTWAAGARGPSFRGAQLLAVSPGGPGFVAVGTADGGTRAAAWTSSDGHRWVPATDGGPAFTDYGLRIAMDSVTAVGAGFVASGLRDSAGNGSGVVWASPDGTTWRRLPAANSFEGAEMAAVVAAAPGVVAVGAIGLPDQWTASVWVGVPPG